MASGQGGHGAVRGRRGRGWKARVAWFVIVASRRWGRRWRWRRAETFNAGAAAIQGGFGLTSLAVGLWRAGDGDGWVVQLERLGTLAWVAVRDLGENGAPMGPNALASSLGGGEKGGEQ